MIWNVANAKSQLSELIGSAMNEPQVIYNRKKPSVVVINYEEFNRLKNLDVLIHSTHKWSKFIEFSNHLTKKGSISIELPSRKDRMGMVV
ncbi:MAG: type II toxin-antitoxin system Phd/YefM family antitoxin [Leptospiraceae bacterium]|nr:type II toxin-antitoxin system Phd/YefM family antitoxin [Leptospiraceae bacterium]